jgi:hypothetical protein
MLTNQPLYPAALDPAHPALARVSASIIAAGDPSGWMRNAGIGTGAPALNGAIAPGITGLGNALVFDGASTYLSYGATNIPAAEFTVLFGGIFDSFDNYRGIADCTVNGASGWNIFQTANGGLWFSVNGYAGSLLSSGWPTGIVVHGALRNKSGTSCDWFRDGVNIASTSGKNPGAVTNPLWIGNQRGSGLPFLSGRFAYFYLLDKYLDDVAIAAIAANPWQLFEPEGEDIWVPSNGRDLSAAAAIQKNAAGAAAIVQVQLLAPAASTQAQTSSAPPLAQKHFLSGAASIHESVASIATTVQVQLLAPAASIQAQAASATSVAQHHILAAAASAQANLSVAMPAFQGHSLLPAPAMQANTCQTGEAALTLPASLSAAGSMQGNTVSTAGISRGLALLAPGSGQENIASAAPVIQKHLLTVPSWSIQDNASNTGATLSKHYLAAANPAQANICGAAAIGGTLLLAVAASRQFNFAVAATMGGATIEPALARARIKRTSIKKPGIPAGTPEWLKTMMEILTGRRGNQIEAPKFQRLTFSETPTQAECEALYSYTNAVRAALEQVISRMDG